MTSRIVRFGREDLVPGAVKEITVACDHMECARSLNDREINHGGGLKEMGWTVTFVSPKLRHYCPEHRRTA